jgi:hypothetical protein
VGATKGNGEDVAIARHACELCRWLRRKKIDSDVMVARVETQHNNTSHSWCEVIAGVVAVAFLVGCLEEMWRCGVVDGGARRSGLSDGLNWARGTPFNSRHTPTPKQAKLAQR